MLTIAICDDERDFREQIRDFLYQYQKSEQIHFRIVETQTGQQLLNLMSEEIDIVFLDIKMKNLNGIQTAQKLRNHPMDVFHTSQTGEQQETPSGSQRNHHVFRAL